MATHGDLTTQGIMAYEAGEYKEANRLLARAVKEDKDSEDAWFYLGMVQTKPEKKKQCMQRVLKINPENEKAKQEIANVAEALANPTQNATVDKVKKRSKEAMGQQVSMNYPVIKEIPGAPQTVSLGMVLGVVTATVQESIPVFAKQEVVKLKDATWWQFFLTVSTFSFVIGLLSSLSRLLIMLDSRFVSFDLLPLISIPILTMITGTIAVAGGAFLSHWYVVKRENGQGTLSAHSLTLAKIWAIPSVILAIIQFLVILIAVLADEFFGGIITLESILRNGFPDNIEGGTIVLTIIAIAITGYTAFLMAKSLTSLHGTSKQLWIPALIMLVVTAIVF